jgi:putative PEP-CTERM system histidine kinase
VPSFGLISFGFAGVGYLALMLLLALNWGGGTPGARLIGVCAATVLWAAILGTGAWTGHSPDLAVLVAELTRFGAWVFLLDGIAKTVDVPRLQLMAVRGALAALLAVVLAFAVLGRASGIPGILPGPAALFSAALACFVLLYVALVARTARNGIGDALAWLLLAVGMVVAYDLVVFALGQFTAVSVGPAWRARGVVNLLALPMIAVAARRNPQWVPRLYLSRDVVYYLVTVTIGCVCIGLVVVLARIWSGDGGPAGRALQMGLLAAAAAALLSLLAVPGPRQRMRVLVTKHFFRSRYDYRAEWLRFIQTLSAAQMDPDPRGSAIRSIAQIIDSPGAVLFQRDDDGGRFVPTCAWPGGHLDLSRLQMVAFLERRQWVIDLDELRADPALYDGMAVPDAFLPSRYARVILPLMHGTDLIGFVILDAPALPFDPNYEDRDLLKTVGRHVATHLAQHEADQRLAESRQFEAFHRLTAFVMHDLKNLAAQLALIVANAERHKHNPEFIDDVVTTVKNSTSRMQRLIEQLRGRELTGASRAVLIEDVVARVCERSAVRSPRPRFSVVDAGLMVDADAEQLTSALEQLVQNAQEATPATGSVTVSVRADGEDCLVTVVDTGCGMTADFIEQRLFKPFDTTKKSQGMGIGAYQLREYVRSLGGTVHVTSSPGAGTTFVVRLKRREA